MPYNSLLNTLDEYMCPQGTTIQDAMARITGKFFLFQVVVDDGRKVLGTLTDGDFRRAILRGVSLDDAVIKSMNSSPVLGRDGDDSENIRKLEQINKESGEHANFLPIVDKDGVLTDIIVHETRKQQSPNALVMAGGLGSRLGERTKNTPKPLLHIGDKPILEHILERLETAGVENVYVSACYLAEQIEAFVDNRTGPAVVDVLHEGKPLGTAGSIGLLPSDLKEPFLVLNGDVLTQVDYGAMFAFYQRHDYDAIIGVAQYRVQVPFGVVRHGDDGLFTGIDEKPNQEYFVAAGIYLLSPEFCSLVPRDVHLDMPDLLNKGRKIGLKIGLFPIHEYWADIGRPDDFEKAGNDFNPG